MWEMPDVRNEQSFVTGKEGCLLAFGSLGQVAGVGRAVDEERGHTNFGLRLGGEFRLRLRVGAPAQCAAVAHTVVVEHDVDELRVIPGRRRPGKLRLRKAPGRTPHPPEFPAEILSMFIEHLPRSLDLEKILVPVPAGLRGGSRFTPVGEVRRS